MSEFIVMGGVISNLLCNGRMEVEYDRYRPLQRGRGSKTRQIDRSATVERSLIKVVCH